MLLDKCPVLPCQDTLHVSTPLGQTQSAAYNHILLHTAL